MCYLFKRTVSSVSSNRYRQRSYMIIQMLQVARTNILGFFLYCRYSQMEGRILTYHGALIII